MTATFTPDQRRATPTPPRALRGLPVLFHLMDVSRPKGFAAPTAPEFSLGIASESDDVQPSIPNMAGMDGAELFDLETAAELVQTKAYGSLPAELPVELPVAHPGLVSGENLEVGVDDTSFSNSTGADDAAPPSLDGESVSHETGEHETSQRELPLLESSLTESIAGTSSLETPPPSATDDTVNLRQRAEERQRRRQEGKKDDWFSTQGRFIAIGFVLAFIVTVYVARTNRKPAAPPVASKPHAHPGEAAHRAAKSADAKLPLASGPAVSITSVRPTEKSPQGEPKTALHPPTIPQLAEQQPVSSPAGADDKLFTFSKPSEDRLATRTDERRATSPPETSPPGGALQAGAGPQAGPTPSSPPTLQPQYPSTSFPGNYQPLGGQASAAQPPAAGPAGGQTPLYPTTNSASGNRYERTGSGIY